MWVTILASHLTECMDERMFPDMHVFFVRVQGVGPPVSVRALRLVEDGAQKNGVAAGIGVSNPTWDFRNMCEPMGIQVEISAVPIVIAPRYPKDMYQTPPQLQFVLLCKLAHPLSAEFLGRHCLRDR